MISRAGSEDWVPDWEPVVLKEDPMYLHEQNGCSRGVLDFYPGGYFFNEQVESFMISQFQRFGIEVPNQDFLIWCWEWSFYHLDQFDPYMFFWGMSDVVLTEDSYYYQYAICDCYDNWFEVEPEQLETFALWGGFKHRFEDIYNSPGLGNYFENADFHLGEMFTEWRDDPDAFPQEEKFRRKYGDKLYDFMHLGVWSCLVWVVSPEAQWWRYDYHPVFRICYDEGECLIHEWTFYDPSQYKRLERPAQSCVACGVREHCVELTHMDDPIRAKPGSYYICEHCLSQGKSTGPTTCGKRECQKFSCPNHPNKNASSLVAADRRYGTLRKTNGVLHRELPGIMALNYAAIEQNVMSISDMVNREFQRLISR